MTRNNLWPYEGESGEHFRTNNSYVIAAFSWVFWLLIWFYFFIGGLWVFLEGFFAVLTCKGKKICEWSERGKLRVFRFFSGLTEYQYSFRPESFKPRADLVIEPQDQVDGFKNQSGRLQSTVYCPDCARLFVEDDVIIIPYCN